MKRKQLESLLTALVPVLRSFVERQIASATLQLRSVLDASIEALPKPKDGKDGVDGKSVTLDDIAPLVPKAADVATLVLEQIELPAAPTAEQVAEKLQPSIPTAEQVAELARAKLTVPTAQEVAALVPKAEEIAALVKTTDPPTLDEIVDAVMLKVKIPTAKEVAAEVIVPSVEITDDTVTREQVTEIVKSLLPSVPTAEEIAKLVELPELPELPALPEIPSAEEIAKLCVPMLPEPPSVEEVVEALKHHIPAPLKGDKGDTGDKGDAGEPVDMEAVSRLLESHFSKWALDFERRALDRVDTFLRTIEKPRDGIDGKDGYGFDDMQLEFNGERTVTIKFERAGKDAKSFEFDLPIVIYRGVYVTGKEYMRGDAVTWDGCTWIAKSDTIEKPAQSDAWQLAVKKGRDGRDGDDPEKKVQRVRIPPRK